MSTFLGHNCSCGSARGASLSCYPNVSMHNFPNFYFICLILLTTVVLGFKKLHAFQSTLDPNILFNHRTIVFFSFPTSVFSNVLLIIVTLMIALPLFLLVFSLSC